MNRYWLAGLALVMLASACSRAEPKISAVEANDTAPKPTVTATVEPTVAVEPTAKFEPTATPEHSATPAPTAVPEPTATPVPQRPGEVLVEGDGWVITEGDVAHLAEFVEQVHEIEFTDVVGVVSDDDIGASFADGFEFFTESDWRLLDGLGLLEPDASRAEVNQFRLDRIRGMCCEGRGRLAVVIEPRSTRIETELIVVHELVHALHLQHPELEPRGGFEPHEMPIPQLAAIEGIAQFITFRYYDTLSPADQAAIADELPIVRETDPVARIPGKIFEYAYGDAVALAEAVYAERGAAGLADLLENPPLTTEQVRYPERWFAGEHRVSQDRPPRPAGSEMTGEGRIGVVMLGWMIEDQVGPGSDHDLLAQWTGDRWLGYQLDGRDCLAVVIEMDTPGATAELAQLLDTDLPAAVSVADDGRIRFDTCIL